MARSKPTRRCATEFERNAKRFEEIVRVLVKYGLAGWIDDTDSEFVKKLLTKAGGEEVSFGPGDLVIFPEGLDCIWDVKEPVKKHYQFG